MCGELFHIGTPQGALRRFDGKDDDGRYIKMPITDHDTKMVSGIIQRSGPAVPPRRRNKNVMTPPATAVRSFAIRLRL
jgi:hypothetical protein